MTACTPSNPNSQFRGDIDEVMLFGTPLAGDDVLYIFSAGYRSSGGAGGGH